MQPNAMWSYLKENFYACSGQLPDVYIGSCSKKDWKKFTAYVNENYTVRFKTYDNDTQAEKINFNTVQDFWNRKLEDGCMASIFVGDIQFNTFFYQQEGIDLNFDISEIRNLEGHSKVVNYLKSICNLLSKNAVIYAEGCEEILLAEVSKDGIRYFDGLNHLQTH